MDIDKINAATTIIGFTGYIGSGCSYIAKTLPSVSDGDQKYKYYKLSDIIRDELSKEGITNPTIKQMQDKGDALRTKHNSGGFLIHELINRIYDDPDFTPGTGIIIDGIKNEREIKTLRQFPYFFLFSVHASTEILDKRRCKNGGQENSDEIYRRDQNDGSVFGQQVKKCNYLSDIVILNEHEYATVDTTGKKKYITDIYQKYVKLIEHLKAGKKSPQHIPSVQEFCMTTAYAVSKLSSCLKRKVGAVIVNETKIANSNNQRVSTPGLITSLPCIVSTGYNEVPLGSHKCVYHEDFEMCYRDHLQELHAGKIKYCPGCGEKIKDITVTCPQCRTEYQGYKKFCKTCQIELEDEYICCCGKKPFKEFLPGEKETPGKLLDMCRALHAEENALLNLVNNSNSKSEDLTLYVTTQPCNLCANKIVTTGIKKVIFEEPYMMKESVDILKAGNISTERFGGVKSSAFFKLYQQ